MEGSTECYDALLQKGVDRLHGHERRLFMAEVALELCGGSGRRAEQRFGWGRATVNQGLHELQSGIRCLRNVAARRRLRWEEELPQRAEDLRAILEPHTHVDPELKSERRYSNLSAREVLEALRQKGYADQDLPTLSHGGVFAVDSLSRSCSGVNLSTSHQRRPSGHGTPRRP